MRPNEIVREIDRLDLSEKLLLVENIWDSIAQKNNSLPMPTWQKVELEKRYRQYKEGALTLHDWETVHAQLRENHK
jgi:putative addiction module component (TIGR02574 family)